MKKISVIFCLFTLISCNEEKLFDFASDVESVQKIKTPFSFKDAKPFLQFAYNRKLSNDSIFIKQGFIPCGVIKKEKNFYAMILVEPAIVNQPYLVTLNFKGQIIDLLKLE